jgi:hypothetical protein
VCVCGFVSVCVCGFVSVCVFEFVSVCVCGFASVCECEQHAVHRSLLGWLSSWGGHGCAVGSESVLLSAVCLRNRKEK